MKRYISAILILCILLQLFGCGYNTFSDITVEELKNYDGSIIKIKTNEDEFTIGEESSKCTTYWEAGDSSIIIMKKEIYYFVEIPADTTHISYNVIEKIEIGESLSTSTYIWIIVGSLVLIGVIVWAGLEAGAFDNLISLGW